MQAIEIIELSFSQLIYSKTQIQKTFYFNYFQNFHLNKEYISIYKFY